MYRLLALLLLVLIVLLQYKLWQGEGSWTSEQVLKEQVEEQRIENARLQQRNAALVAEVEDLKNGEAAIEERARSEMGMVKPGETFYRVVEPADPSANVRPEDVPEDAASPASPASSATSVSTDKSPGSSASDMAASSASHAPASGRQAPGAPSSNAQASKK
ncbi:MAG TPA: cell division protein FtsB [Xanthomonadaceae bacterium]|jgi:cell division protein FtsB|nr:cell division protein FtsB [Xanthomonadaceae bacterium]